MTAWAQWVEMLVDLEARKATWLAASPRDKESVQSDVRRLVSSFQSAEAVENALCASAEETLEAIDEAAAGADDGFAAGRPKRIALHVRLLTTLDTAIEARREALCQVERLSRQSNEAEEALHGEVSQLRADLIEAELRVSACQVERRDLERQARVARDTADVMTAACTARTADADALKAALEDAEVRTRDALRRALAAEQEVLDEGAHVEKQNELRAQLDFEKRRGLELVAMNRGLEERLEAERAKRLEVERALQNVFSDVVRERDRANREQARTEAAKPELDQLRQDVVALRGQLATTVAALGERQRSEPAVVAAVFQEMGQLQSNFEASVRATRNRVDALQAKNAKTIQRLSQAAASGTAPSYVK